MVTPWLVLFKICLLQIPISSTYGNDGNSSDGARIEFTDTYTTCSKGWFAFGDLCYSLGGKTKIGRENWVNAQKTCKEEHNGNLATVYSQELQDFLTAFLLMNAQSNVWIGLHDRGRETDYKWADGTPVGFTFFEPGEPSGHSRQEVTLFFLSTSFQVFSQYRRV
ncbi:hypothetical protein AVEN_25929-1 [Araneus ventricosus]|uniref:C-type lectin domain-containing protein n=1 Tax=Araneus ventricosus TaxID=182803 RepID=A0A4Y2HG60_ARAVE|nr:hypothetical protein AVEN_25929-1 [Araneus ventricosus]